jgi:hypothetical protein
MTEIRKNTSSPSVNNMPEEQFTDFGSQFHTTPPVRVGEVILYMSLSDFG